MELITEQTKLENTFILNVLPPTSKMCPARHFYAFCTKKKTEVSESPIVPGI